MTEDLQNNFAALGLPPVLVKNLAQMGVCEPKPIQEKAIAPLLQGRDILAIAQTGSGKTFAFALPVLARLIGLGARRQPKAAAALILTPTRELAVQIEEAMRAVTRNMHLRLGLVLGGVSRLRQIKQMAAGVDVLIATPGRLMDHVREGNIDLSHTHAFVLDEADRMLDMGFIRDVRTIAARLAKHRQTALFSATMPKEVAGLAESLLQNPLRVETAPQGTVVAAIREIIYAVPQKDKKEALTRLLAQEAFRSTIVFTRTKHGADGVARFLAKAGCPVEVIHGNKSQNARQRALDSFRKGEIRVLVATDIAARGIDIPGITHVVNYEFPVEAESYVHRIGRTGRNGATGDAVTLYDAAQEASRLRAIERLTAKKLPLAPLPPLAEAVFPKMEKVFAGKPAYNAGKKADDKTGKPRRKRKFGPGPAGAGKARAEFAFDKTPPEGSEGKFSERPRQRVKPKKAGYRQEEAGYGKNRAGAARKAGKPQRAGHAARNTHSGEKNGRQLAQPAAGQAQRRQSRYE